MAAIDDDSDEDQDELMSSMKNGNNDMLKIFSCRHVYHIKCLKRYLKKKVSDADNCQKKMEKIKCPTCYVQDLDIEADTKGREKRA